MAKSSPLAKDVDEYLAALPPKPRAALTKLRKLIKAAAPKAEEVISYRVPAYKHQGMLVGFAAFTDHCSFFVMSPALMTKLKEELKPYELSTGTIRFAHDEPLPGALVKKIVKARLEENEQHALRRKRAKKKTSRK